MFAGTHLTERFARAAFLHGTRLMQLTLDRFVAMSAKVAIDLATGRRAWLRPLPPAGVAEESRWSEQCDRALRSAGSTAIGLVDYGVVGEHHRFEAWSAPSRRPLRGNGSSRVVFADEAAVEGLFAEIAGSSPRVVAVQGASGTESTAALMVLARRARLAGFVPIGIDVLVSPRVELRDELRTALRGRSVFVLSERKGARACDPEMARMWRALVDRCLASPRAHLAAVATAVEVPGFDRLRLVGIPESTGSARPRMALRAAEGTVPYLVDPSHRDQVARTAGHTPTRDDTARLQSEIARAMGLLKTGRRAAGERLLREAYRAAARREVWREAQRGAMLLAEQLLARGRARDAVSVLDDAREFGARAAEPGQMCEVARLAGRAWTDLCRLDDAERVLTAAVAGSRSTKEPNLPLRVELARCLWWRGRFAEADALVSDAESDTCVVVTSLRVRLALGAHDLERAVRTARLALSLADRESSAAAKGQAALAAAWAYLAAGDLDAVAKHGATSIAAGRLVRDPRCVVGGRLLIAESLRRLGRAADALPLLRELHRLAPKLPPLLRAQVTFVGDLTQRDGTPTAILKRHVSATGLHALALLVPRADRVEDGAASGLGPCLVQIVRDCQTVGDERTVMQNVCVRLRDRVGAAGVTVFGGRSRGIEPLARAGQRTEASVASRCMAAGIPIEPRPGDGPAASSAPIVYGGNIVGALVVSWPLGSCRNRTLAGDLIALTAAAVAPIVSTMLVARESRGQRAVAELIGESGAMQEIRQAVEAAAPAPFPVLVSGESGTGKELVARALWRRSLRAARPFVSVNCAALPEDLVEAELFGHARGAFTGATGDRSGVFEEAHEGTLFLDEIGELSPRAQAKLLRVLQDGELRRVGENIPRRVDVRVIAATNRDLRQEAAAGRFRSDLVYRLDVVRIALPPLRERREDIAALIDWCWRDAAARTGSRATLAASTVGALTRYDWPGNVRELQNVLAALAVRCPKRGVVTPAALPPDVGGVGVADDGRLETARRVFEERFVRAALARAGGRQARAAAELGLSRQGLTKLMKRLGIESRRRA